MTYCDLYLRRDVFFLGCLRQTASGVLRSAPPYMTVQQDSCETLGVRVLAILNSTEATTIVPNDWIPEQRIWDFAGLRSWNSFAKGAKYLYFECEGECVRVVPNRKAYGSAFAPCIDQIVSCAPEADAINEAIHRALLACD